MAHNTHKEAARRGRFALGAGNGGKMVVRETSAASQDKAAGTGDAAEQAVEAAHLAGSALVTGAVAVILTVVAIPVSIGLGLALGTKKLLRRGRGG